MVPILHLNKERKPKQSAHSVLQLLALWIQMTSNFTLIGKKLQKVQ